ncbi:MAG: type II toxin-antitoxin system Phd/YefM family antitoxin [Candidatus Rokubacteria bacterium]|nr:type II toxin-antitoxin system Phd/YefM family antitoxin [Candidatus Rokubacteria bacterium]
MKTMPAGEFKARCLRVMEDVKKYRTPVVITKKGRPVAKLVPADPDPGIDLFGCMAGEFTYIGDVESPVVPPEAWDVVRLTKTPARKRPSRSRRRRR